MAGSLDNFRWIKQFVHCCRLCCVWLLLPWWLSIEERWWWGWSHVETDVMRLFWRQKPLGRQQTDHIAIDDREDASGMLLATLLQLTIGCTTTSILSRAWATSYGYLSARFSPSSRSVTVTPFNGTRPLPHGTVFPLNGNQIFATFYETHTDEWNMQNVSLQKCSIQKIK